MKAQQLPKTIGGRVTVTDALNPQIGEPVCGGGSVSVTVEKQSGRWIVVALS